jgi:hypothetical protein
MLQKTEFVPLDGTVHSVLNCFPEQFYDERMTRGYDLSQPEG